MDRVFRKVAKNSTFNLTGRLFILAANIIIIPFVIKKIGIASYGIWALLYAFTNYFNLLDLGISSSYTRFIAEEVSREKGDVNSIVASGFYINLLLAVFFLAFGFLFKDFFITKILKSGDPSSISFIYFSVLFIFVLNYLFGIFESVLDGLQRMELKNSALIFSKALELGFTFIFLSYGFGLIGMVLAVLIGRACYIMAILFFSSAIYYKISFLPRHINIHRSKEILKFGYKIQIINLGTWLNQNFDKFLISYFLSVNFVAFYDFAQKISETARNICISLIGAVIPAASEIANIGGMDDLKELFFKGMNLLAVAAFPLFFLILINARDLVSLWLGAGYEKTVIALMVLVCGSFVNILTGIGTSIVRGINRPMVEVRYAVLYLGLHIFLSTSLILKFGFYGAVSGVAMASVFSSIYFLVIFTKSFEIRFKDFVERTIRQPLAISIIASAVLYLSENILPFASAEGRIARLGLVSFKSAIFITVFFAYLYRRRYFDFFKFFRSQKAIGG